MHSDRSRPPQPFRACLPPVHATTATTAPPPLLLGEEAVLLQSILPALTVTRTPTQTVVLLKSILLFSHTHVHVAIVADSHRTFDLAIEASTYGWSADACARFSFSRHRLYYPPGTEFMRHLNRPCSSSRHFFPEYFAGTRYMLNLDTDVVLLAPIEDLWAHFHRFGARPKVHRVC